MTRRGLTLLSGITGIAVLLALWLSNIDAGNGDSQKSGQAVFPGLGEKLATANAISLSGPQGTTSLSLRDGRWEVAERFGYGADHAQVGVLLAGLVRARRLEPKTATLSRLDQIGLGDGAVELQVSGPAETRMAALRIGNAREAGVGAGTGDGRKTFVWVEGDDRSWLVSSLPSLTTSPILWLDNQIIDLSNARVSAVTIERSDGDNLSLSGQANNLAALQVEGQTADERLVGRPANETLTALADLRLDDVALENEIIGAIIATARYRTFDGLVVVARVLAAEAGGTWATFRAKFNAGAALDEEGPSLMLDAPADGAAEAEELNARWEKWVFRLSDMDAEALTRPRSAVVTAAEPDEEES